MNSLNEQSLKRLELLVQETTMMLGDRAADQLATILTTAYTAAFSENPSVQEKSLDIIKRAFNSLWEAIDNDPGPPVDPRYKWMEEHPEIISKYKGKHVVMDSDPRLTGIIASGDSFEEVYEKVKDRHDLGLLCFDVIPDDMAFGGVAMVDCDDPPEPK